MNTKEKLKALIEKEFELKEKVLIAVFIGFALSFNFIFYGMTHIFLSNNEDFMLPAARIFGTALIISLLTWLGVSLILFILPGKIYTIAASFTAGLILAGYLQGNVFNNMTPLGALTGDAIYWRMYAKETLINTAIWLVLFLLPVTLRMLTNAKTWKTAVLILCVLLTGMQASALYISYTSAGDEIHYVPEYYLSRDGAYEVSSKKNILVFVVDRLDYSYVEEIRKDDPEFFDRLDGFTDFTDAACVYSGTFPSVVQMTTGIPYYYNSNRGEYFDYAWNNSQFIDTLKDAGYSMTYHISENYAFTNFEQIFYAVNNIRDGRPVVTTASIAQNFLTLTAYRFAPMALKPSFWLSVVDFETTGDIPAEDIVSDNDPLFLTLLKEKGLTLKDDSNYFFIHLVGAHPPYVMNEDGIYAGGETDLVSQTKGCFNIIYRYIDEMKELGVYEDSTIIITGDHGWGTFHVGFFVKPAGAAGTPLAQNDAPVSINEDLLPTILKSEGIAHNDFGVSAFDIDPDEIRERDIVIVLSAGDNVVTGTDAVLFYKYTGKATGRISMELVEIRDILFDFNIGLPFE